MIKIFTDEREFEHSEIVKDNEAFFLVNFKMSQIGDNEIEAMRKIDNAEIVDFSNGTIKTPFGTTSIFDLSTGCKTVLNYITIAKNRAKFDGIRAINITESGANAIELLFEVMERFKDESVAVVLEHEDETWKCKEREYLIDGTKLRNNIRFLY